MPKIPTDIGSLPTEFRPLPEDLVYGVVIRQVTVEGPDKNGQDYLAVQYEVTQPEEWRGRRLFDGYIGLPSTPTPTMDASARRHLQERGVRLARWVRCFKVPYDSSGFETENAVGLEGSITTRIEEYQGQARSKVNDYLA